MGVDPPPRKILSFLSIQIDHRIAMGTSCKRVNPHPWKGTILHASTKLNNVLGTHHEKPHLKIVLFQMKEENFQWTKRWFMVPPPCKIDTSVIKHPSSNLCYGSPLLRLSTIETLPKNANKANTSNLGGARPHQRQEEGKLSIGVSSKDV